jgi:hypothetical protein
MPAASRVGFLYLISTFCVRMPEAVRALRAARDLTRPPLTDEASRRCRSEWARGHLVKLPGAFAIHDEGDVLAAELRRAA